MNPRLGLVHLYIVEFSDCLDASLLREYEKLLSPDEIVRQQSLTIDQVRVRNVISRAFVRTVLSHHAPIHPREWRFTTNGHGKPAICNEHGAAARIAFNLSHTREAAVMAVSIDRLVGIDIESSCVNLELCESARIFSALELSALGTLRPDKRREHFLEYWTLKESYLKARGTGLSTPLYKIAFDLAVPGAISAQMAPVLNDRPDQWNFRLFETQNGTVLALCAARNGVPMETVHRQIIPLRGLWPMTFKTKRSDEAGRPPESHRRR
ncbi:4'-phosphopantetheinyl transferase [Paraburkholderia terricola]|uniref:4'-phosphopantetheinyl transferase family protein n=1 Tax=Paraburkholderia terricola TaxID=169427 RepID=UPI00285DBD3B|nr:4'-phosphopantetheinyl transferase superfamily protein [Paraburkholderia terricola]MDR6450027.1 4'-phosphopantetheinyl transferase [Paraburkholderia terricola]